jgi:hypothetical protein
MLTLDYLTVRTNLIYNFNLQIYATINLPFFRNLNCDHTHPLNSCLLHG